MSAFRGTLSVSILRSCRQTGQKKLPDSGETEIVTLLGVSHRKDEGYTPVKEPGEHLVIEYRETGVAGHFGYENDVGKGGGGVKNRVSETGIGSRDEHGPHNASDMVKCLKEALESLRLKSVPKQLEVPIFFFLCRVSH